MPHRGARIALAAIALLAAGAPSEAAAAGQRPNVVVIQTDDQTGGELYARFAPPGRPSQAAMPNTLGLIAAEGITFSRYYVSDPLCCPSRASLLTGEYAHNSGVLGNGPYGGGYGAFDKLNNLAPWLQATGYRTIHIGKFLNFYGQPPYSDPAEVPAGWSDWQTLVGEDSTHYFYGYRLNHNGAVEGPFGDIGYAEKDPPGCPAAPSPQAPCAYQTDILTRRALDAIGASAPGGPFFLSLDYVAPHGDFQPPWGPEPAPRHYGSWAGVPLPRPPGFNERDVSDKPRFIRRARRLGAIPLAQTQEEWQKQIESLRAVDEGVARIVQALEAYGELGNTYIFFTSDNGFFHGEHRIQREKFLPYEPSVRVPLLVRGPGIPPGSRSAELTANLDLAPTILSIAGGGADRPLDGRSLLPYAHRPGTRSRRPILLEAFTRAVDLGTARSGRASASIWAPVRDYRGIRVGPYKYVRYAGGQKELYDLRRDPYELHSVQRDRRYRTVRAYLAKRLRWLKSCRGRTCRHNLVQRWPQPNN